MSDQQYEAGQNGGTPIPQNPGGEAREQLEENDEHLREGDEDTPEETVPEVTTNGALDDGSQHASG